MRIPSSSKSPAAGRDQKTNSGGARRKKAAAPTPCCSKVGLKRGPWTAEEDEVLSAYIRREGEGRWRTLPTRAGLLRCGKSCRLRWMNYLRPSVKRGHIAPDEEDLILRLHRLLGNRWSLIAGRIPGRTDNEIKNYWNTHLSKKLISKGIDPRTHKPLSNPSSSTVTTPPLLHGPSSSSSTPPTSPNPSSPIDAALSDLPPSTPPFFDVPSLEFNCRALQDLESPVGFDRGLEEYCDISCGGCADDAFSSFLNSLIKEDESVSAQCQLPHDHQRHNVGGATRDAIQASTAVDAGSVLMVSSSAQQALGLGGALSSSSAFNGDTADCEPNDPTRLTPSISKG